MDKDITIHKLFEEQAALFSNEIAVIDNERSVTYDELNCAANKLAWHLKKIGVRTGQMVGISVERSAEMIIALLGILKAGAVYVPLDSSYPLKRLEYILNDSKVSIVLTAKELEEFYADRVEQAIVLDDNFVNQVLAHEKTVNLSEKISADKLAYVLYTSGSTGNPKGVLGHHRGVVNRTMWMKKHLGCGGKEVLCQRASLNYVDSLIEIADSLLLGNKLILIPKHVVQDSGEFIALLKKHAVTHILTIPSVLQMFVDYHADVLKTLSALKSIFVGGELVASKLISKIYQLLPNVKISNLYGLTEAMEVTLYTYPDTVKSTDPSIIGKPIDNMYAHVLDENKQPVAAGEIGELYIGGCGVSYGYLNNEILTAERFLTQNDEVVYKTGDMVKCLADGNLEYIGRSDYQVNILGVRIELGEIEKTIIQCLEVSQAVVCAHGDGYKKHLVAYYTLDPQLQISDSTEKIKSYVEIRLPDFMHPSRYVLLKQFPFTSSGKVDRNKLVNAAENSSFTVRKSQYIDSIQYKIMLMWEKLLDVNEIDVDADFFDLGGNSITAAQLVYLINDEFSTQHTVAWLFSNKTIEQQANSIRNNSSKNAVYTPIITFNKKEKPQLFMIHPGIVGAEAYAELAGLLNREIGFYGVDSYNLYNSEVKNSINDLANYYASQIEKNIVDKQIFLGGWSLGGLIAYEVAILLSKANIEIKNLFLIDPDPPGYQHADKNNVKFGAQAFAKAPKYILNYLEKLPKEILNRVLININNDVKMALEYNPLAYNGNVTLFQATDADNTPLLDGNIDIGGEWKEYINDLTVIPVYGDHFTIMDGENIKKIAENIGAIILE